MHEVILINLACSK